MIEDTQTPQNNNPDQGEKEAKATKNAALRILEANPSPNYTARRIGAAFAIGAVLTGGLAAQAISNEIKQNDRTTSIKAEYMHDQNILKEIQSEAHAKVDPANIAGMFVVNDRSVNEISNEIARIQPEYKDADEATKNWIDYTILESGKAQGSYDSMDNFVVSRTVIDGKKTLIVQDGNHLELPMPPAYNDDGTIPAPETH